MNGENPSTQCAVILDRFGNPVTSSTYQEPILDKHEALENNVDILEKREKNLTEMYNTREAAVSKAVHNQERANKLYQQAFEKQKLQKQHYQEALARVRNLDKNSTPAQVKEAFGKLKYAKKGLDIANAALSNTVEQMKKANIALAEAKISYYRTKNNLKTVQQKLHEVKPQVAESTSNNAESRVTHERNHHLREKARANRMTAEVQAEPVVSVEQCNAQNIKNENPANKFNKFTKIGKALHTKGGKAAAAAIVCALIAGIAIACTSNKNNEEVVEEVAEEPTTETTVEPADDSYLDAAERENAQLDELAQEAIKYDEYTIQEGDCVWNIAKQALDGNPTVEEIVKKVKEIMDDNQLKFDNNREVKDYYVPIYEGKTLNIRQ